MQLVVVCVCVRPDLDMNCFSRVLLHQCHIILIVPTHRSLTSITRNVFFFFYSNLTLAVRLGMIEFAAKHDRAKFLLRGVSCRWMRDYPYLLINLLTVRGGEVIHSCVVACCLGVWRPGEIWEREREGENVERVFG